MKIGRSLRYVSHTSPYTIFDIILDFMNAKYIRNSLFILCYSMFLALTSACDNGLEAVSFEKQKPQRPASIGDDMCIIQSLGFDTLDVVKLKSGYLIQGDIYIEKVNLLLMVSHKQDKLIILPV